MCEFVEIDAECVGETEMAYCLDTAEGQKWIPKSVCGEMNEDPYTIEVEEWWATKEGLT